MNTNSQLVVLTYFKPSGKYYSEGTYVTKQSTEADVNQEVRTLLQEGTLPDLAPGCGKDFTILVDYGRGLLSVPALIHKLT